MDQTKEKEGVLYVCTDLGLKSLGFLDEEMQERGGTGKGSSGILRRGIRPGIDGEFGPLDEAENDGVLLSDQRLSHRFQVHFLEGKG